MADFAGAVPVRTERDDEFKIILVDGASGDTATNVLTVNADGSINTVTKISDGTDTVEVNANGSINVVASATDFDIRALSHTTDSVSIGDGTDLLAINTDGSVNAIVTYGTSVCDYGTSAALAANGTANFDYVITSGKTFTGECVLVGGEGKTKAEVGTWNGSTFTTKAVYFQQPAFNVATDIKAISAVGDGTLAIRVIVTNKDKTASDVYCTIQGFEK